MAQAVLQRCLRMEFTLLAWLFLCPLIVGIARGTGLLVLRPNEMLLAGIVACVGFRLLWDVQSDTLKLPSPRQLDGSVFVLLVFGAAIPLLLGYGRGTQLGSDDVLYAMVFAKYAMLYGVFRFAARSADHITHCFVAMLASGAVVAVIALLQARGLLGVPAFLATYYDAPFEGSTGPNSLRASSTIASSFGLADSMAILLGLCISLFYSKLDLQPRQRMMLVAAGLLFGAAALAAGSFSGVIGCAVVVLVTGLLLGKLQHILAVSLPAAAAGAVLLWPTIAARLEGFSSYRSLPRSWLGRIENLDRFFWPELFNGWNWLLGVRPSARIAAPEAWRDWVYIESGYTWLLWVGGLPLLLGFVYFLWSALGDLLLNAGEQEPVIRAVRVATAGATAMIAVLMVFDPHLTVRGCADLYFPMLALSIFGPVRKRVLLARRPARVAFAVNAGTA